MNPTDLQQIRNRKIRERFYFWYEKRELRYDRTIEKLVLEEFFLQPSTIEAIVKRTGRYSNDPEFVPKRN